MIAQAWAAQRPPRLERSERVVSLGHSRQTSTKQRSARFSSKRALMRQRRRRILGCARPTHVRKGAWRIHREWRATCRTGRGAVGQRAAPTRVHAVRAPTAICEVSG
eukprot:963241-Pleurochrysis_carterae.AAC.1